MNENNLRRLLSPQTIAVIGGSEAAAVMRQCDRIGFNGEIWPVNPNRSELGGRTCFSTLDELPFPPDAAFVAVPREPTVEIIAELAKMGAGGAVCYASGFAEIGGEGVTLQGQLQRVLGELALVGPNCYGLLNYFDGVALWPDEHGGKRIDRGVAIVTQSGNISISISMQQRWLPLGYLIATGNQAGVTIPEYVDTLLDDERVTAIGLHLEGLEDVAAFSHAALKALHRKVPLVVLKSGSTDLGSELTMSHTSSLAGADSLYDALFQRFGIPRVHSIPEFLETLKLLSIIGPLASKCIASISSSGGEAAIVADRAGVHGLDLPPLVPHQRDALLDVLGDRVVLTNPLDYHTYIWGDEQAQYRAFGAMMLGDQDITLKILDFPRPDICDLTLWANTARSFCQAAVDGEHNGVVVATMQENLPQSIGEELVAYGLAPMLGLDECLVAIGCAHQVYTKQQVANQLQPLASLQGFSGPPSTCLSMTTPYRHTLDHIDMTILNEAESKAMLREAGIPVTDYRECSALTASTAAAALGFPVAVKVLSRKYMHKSDVGGVLLNLWSEDEVQIAVAQMAHLGEHFLVEPMAPNPVAELFLGLTSDPQFGLALVIGAGGTLVELFQDSAVLLLPVSREEIEESIYALAIAPLLDGYRDQQPADMDAFIDAALALSELGINKGNTLVEVDINPFFIFPFGCGGLAVDAVLVFNQEPSERSMPS